MNRRRFLARSVSAVALAAIPQTAGALRRFHQTPGPRTKVRRHRGQPRSFLDREPYTKPVFETYAPQTKYFRQFAEAGTDVFSFSTNLGTGFAAPTWIGPDSFDFQQLDERAHRVLEANPRGLLLPRIYLTTPDW